MNRLFSLLPDHIHMLPFGRKEPYQHLADRDPLWAKAFLDIPLNKHGYPEHTEAGSVGWLYVFNVVFPFLVTGYFQTTALKVLLFCLYFVTGLSFQMVLTAFYQSRYVIEPQPALYVLDIELQGVGETNGPQDLRELLIRDGHLYGHWSRVASPFEGDIRRFYGVTLTKEAADGRLPGNAWLSKLQAAARYFRPRKGLPRHRLPIALITVPQRSADQSEGLHTTVRVNEQVIGVFLTPAGRFETHQGERFEPLRETLMRWGLAEDTAENSAQLPWEVDPAMRRTVREPVPSRRVETDMVRNTVLSLVPMLLFLLWKLVVLVVR